VALENITLEHERDLTNSANERIIFSESFILTDYMLSQMSSIISGLEVFPERIEKNLTMTSGLVMAERLMIALTEKGMARQEAHELLREASHKALKDGKHLMEELLSNKEVLKHLKKEELELLFDEKTYIGKAIEIVEKVVKELS
jgi:adenylosuccinate lyase